MIEWIGCFITHPPIQPTTVNIRIVVGPTELFAGDNPREIRFRDPPYRFRPPLPDWIDHLKSFQDSTRVRRFTQKSSKFHKYRTKFITEITDFTQ